MVLGQVVDDFWSQASREPKIYLVYFGSGYFFIILDKKTLKLELLDVWNFMKKNIVRPSRGHGKVHIFWEGHKILRNLHLTFDWHYIGQK